MGFENLPTQDTNENKAEQEAVKDTNENKAEQETAISLEILKSTSDFQEVFNANNKKLWLMGSLSIAAHLGRPHRNIENDIDFFTTSDNMDEVILDLEDKGFVVEEFSGNKFRATNPDTGIRADMAILDINSDTGNYEVAEWSFPASGFEGEEKEIEGLSVRPILCPTATVGRIMAKQGIYGVY